MVNSTPINIWQISLDHQDWLAVYPADRSIEDVAHHNAYSYDDLCYIHVRKLDY